MCSHLEEIRVPDTRMSLIQSLPDTSALQINLEISVAKLEKQIMLKQVH